MLRAKRILSTEGSQTKVQDAQWIGGWEFQRWWGGHSDVNLIRNLGAAELREGSVCEGVSKEIKQAMTT